ncbi:hypothetical protein FB45DRAFT_1010995 [Roridomyces roridus]|uniref:MYND-type domain-containing protein n=1 Tax=Roridomyces roridus TaxID=1738132 RepID=A0AAD7F8B2_9AGAR|nr:hypothetical protein FB45DRAFT_1010995 [Roridomyces roridus]
MVMIGPPPVQLAASNPKKWDADWQDLLRRAHTDPDIGPGKQLRTRLGRRSVLHPDGGLKDTVLYTIRVLREGLCALQAELTREALLYFVRARFEQKWIAAAPEERGKPVLAALCDVCTSAMNLHQAREFFAVELNVAAHQKDGRLLVGYIKEIMVVENPAANPEDPIFISHPVWDVLEHGASVHEKIALKSILVLRNKLIAHVLFFVLRSFLGLDVPRIRVNKHATNKKSTLCAEQPTKLTEFLIEGFGRAGAERHVKLEREAMKELYSEPKQHCFNCQKPNNTKMRYARCKRCWDSMKRETLYCSPACQKVDWKNGHKRRPALVGFKCSIPLMYLVGRINQSPDYDYFVWTAQYPIYLLFTYKPVQAAVLGARTKALASGDRPSVAKLAHMLIFTSQHDPRARSLGVTKELIVKQLKDEYEFEEIALALDEMRARMAWDPLHRPPLLIDAGFSAGAWEEYQDTWSMVGMAEIGVVPDHPRLVEDANRGQ